MSSTEILFNSPALHSLKRAQLVKICKRHGVKAAGTNEALVAKLQQFAKTLPVDRTSLYVSTSDAAAEDEDTQHDDDDEEGDDGHSTATEGVIMTAQRGRVLLARPSEPWSIVEEESREEENSLPTAVTSLNSKQSGLSLSTIGEFGHGSSGGSTKSPSRFIRNVLENHIPELTDPSLLLVLDSSVSSSIKAFASSLKRVATGGAHSSLLRSKTSPNKVSPSELIQKEHSPSPTPPATPEPVPSTYLPDNTLAQSTIRLIPSTLDLTNMDGPTDTYIPTKTHDGEDGDGSSGSDDDWLASRQKRPSSIYPQLPEFAQATAAASRADLSAIMPGGFEFSDPPAAASPVADPSTVQLPLDLHSPTTAATAASVLEEINKRLGMAPNAPNAMTFETFANKGPLFSTAPKIDWANSGLKEAKGGDRFASAHDGMFNQMDSITTHYAAKRAAPTISQLLGSKKRKSSAQGGLASAISPRTRPSFSATPSAAKRRSRASMAVERKSIVLPSVITKKLLDMPQPESSNPVLANEPAFPKKRITIFEEGDDVDGDVPMPGGFDGGSRPSVTVKPSDAAKKRLDTAKAKRRSSSGRKSLGRASIIGTGASTSAKPVKASSTRRFGFLKSSAKLVKSAWNAATTSGPSTSARSTAKQACVVAPVKPIAAVVPSVSSNKSRADDEVGTGIFGGAMAKSSFLKKKEIPKVSEVPSASTSAAAKKQMIAATIAAKSPPPPPPSAPSSKLPVPSPAASNSNSKRPSSPPPPLPILGKPSTGTPLQPSILGSIATRRVVSGSSMRVRALGRKSTIARASTMSSANSRPPLPSAVGGSPALNKAEGSLRVSNTSALAQGRVTPVGRRTPISTAPTGLGFASMGVPPPAKAGGPVKSSTLTAPTASSLARLQSNVRPPTISNKPIQNQNQPPSVSRFGFDLNAQSPSTTPLKKTSESTFTQSPTVPKTFGPLEAVTNTMHTEMSMMPQGERLEDESMADFMIPMNDSSATNTLSSTASGSRSGRRPRISRSMVIAKLGEKRAMADAAFMANANAIAAARPSAVGASAGTGSTSSGVSHARRSHGIGGAGGTPRRMNTKDAEMAILASAKKAVRRSEVVRRQSKAPGPITGPSWAGIKAGFTMKASTTT
ncbi:hypothetical protein FRB96_003947 [Tulasnella sp. 330]|nr:hypothetical protein FRB96_003947 [Tulasnella sp. 330]